MGCDIHCHVEIKVKGKWLHYNHPRIGRDYRLFCMMAGVRQYGDVGEPKPIASPRGLPKDVAETTSFDASYWGDDAHSASWLSCEEAGRVRAWHEENGNSKPYDEPLFGYLFGNYIDSYLKYPEEGKLIKKLGYEDVRVVFWFDN